jgi:predicted  nucleic acid-binding Zn-ribbon protein
MNDALKSVGDTKLRKDELESDIGKEIDRIKHDLYNKLNRMVDDLKNHQTYQRGEALKLQQEISILKKEKLDLYQRVTDLQRKISDMELMIGQDFDRLR